MHTINKSQVDLLHWVHFIKYYAAMGILTFASESICGSEFLLILHVAPLHTDCFQSGLVEFKLMTLIARYTRIRFHGQFSRVTTSEMTLENQRGQPRMQVWVVVVVRFERFVKSVELELSKSKIVSRCCLSNNDLRVRAHEKFKLYRCPQ